VSGKRSSHRERSEAIQYFARFEARLEKGLAEVRAELAEARTEVAGEMAELRTGMAGQRAELIKWMFIFWAGTVIPLAGLAIALSRL
jgi:hypothetical protein